MSAAHVLCRSRHGAAAIAFSVALGAAPATALIDSTASSAPAEQAPVVMVQATAAASPDQVPAPDLFEETGAAIWDGKRTLQGVWVAHPSATSARRVRIFNTATGEAVDGALFKRDPALIGPDVLVSSEAAQSLGMRPGEEVGLRIVALTPSQRPQSGRNTPPAADDAAEVASESLATMTSDSDESPAGPAAVPAGPATTSPATALPESGTRLVEQAEASSEESAPTTAEPASRGEPEAGSTGTRLPAPPPDSPGAISDAVVRQPIKSPGPVFRSPPPTNTAPETAEDPAEPDATAPEILAPQGRNATPDEPSVAILAAAPRQPVIEGPPLFETAATPAEPIAAAPEPAVGGPVPALAPLVQREAPLSEAVTSNAVSQPRKPDARPIPTGRAIAGSPAAGAAPVTAAENPWKQMAAATRRADADPVATSDVHAVTIAKAPDREPVAISDAPDASSGAMPDPIEWKAVAKAAVQAAAPAREREPAGEELAREASEGDQVARDEMARDEAAGPLLLPFIQAGIFGVDGNATRLIGRLEAADLPAIGKRLTLNGKPATRVLAGPFETRAKRDAALRAIRELGLKDATPVAR